jgi:hypothetical protein
MMGNLENFWNRNMTFVYVRRVVVPCIDDDRDHPLAAALFVIGCVRPWPPLVSGDCVTGGKATCTSTRRLCFPSCHASTCTFGRHHHPTWTHKPAFFSFFHKLYYTLIYCGKPQKTRASIVLYQL